MDKTGIPSVNSLNSSYGGRWRSFLDRVLDRFFGGIEFGNLTIELPSGSIRRFDGELPGPQGTLRIRSGGFVWRVLLGGDLGLAESFMADDWDTPDLSELLKLGAANAAAFGESLSRHAPIRMLNRLRHARRSNTRAGSRRNIMAHYDLGNVFYSYWLDETMSYSSALFDRLDEPHEVAQRRKYMRIAAQLELQPGDSVLEIGCGWGGFAEIAAGEFGCNVIGLTLSCEQAEFTRRRMSELGLADRVEIRLQDYRDVTDRFNKVASIEMFEAVGEENWTTYFRTVERILRPHGRACLQAITIDERSFEDYRNDPDFIQQYIFPGGMLPTLERLEATASSVGMRMKDTHFFGNCYAESLRRWRGSFASAWPEIASLGFDRRFERMWTYYLCYCEAGFESGKIDVGQFLFIRS